MFSNIVKQYSHPEVLLYGAARMYVFWLYLSVICINLDRFIIRDNNIFTELNTSCIDLVVKTETAAGCLALVSKSSIYVHFALGSNKTKFSFQMDT